jgi:hypothetical protein
MRDKFTRRITLRLVAVIGLVITLTACGGKWGTLANEGFDGQPVRTILFFAGQQLDGKTLPQNICTPPINVTQSCATVWPLDETYLDWRNPANRVHAVQKIVGLRFNTISMSSWGESWLPCAVNCPYVPHECCGKVALEATCQKPVPRCFFASDGRQTCRIGWYGAANTQLSPAARNELFEAAVQQPVLIMPFIESRFDYDWNFRTDFPTSLDQRFKGKLAPGLISQIEDLIAVYLKNPDHPEWREKWALVYDQHGEERYAVVIVQASSDSLGANDDQKFAEAFDQVAQRIFEDTQIKVGFFIDPIPRDPISTYSCPGIIGLVQSTYAASFRPDTTGSFLREQISILGIHAYSPEGWIDGPPSAGPPVNECFKIAWKEDFSRRWVATGIPFLQDITPGYDGSKLFTSRSGLHRWGYNSQWRKALLGMTSRYGRAGLVYNSWNGYCEGLAAMETHQDVFNQESSNVSFIRDLMAIY